MTEKRDARTFQELNRRHRLRRAQRQREERSELEELVASLSDADLRLTLRAAAGHELTDEEERRLKELQDDVGEGALDDTEDVRSDEELLQELREAQAALREREALREPHVVEVDDTPVAPSPEKPPVSPPPQRQQPDLPAKTPREVAREIRERDAHVAMMQEIEAANRRLDAAWDVALGAEDHPVADVQRYGSTTGPELRQKLESFPSKGE